MSRARKIAAAAGSLALALGIGFSAAATEPEGDLGEPIPSAVIADMVAPGLTQDIGLTRMARMPRSKPVVPEAPCVIRTRATPEPAAFVRLHVSAVCLPESRVTVHHNGMLFTARMDGTGNLDILVPALAERAVFTFTFDGDQMAMAMTRVPDIAGYNRVVLLWRGDAGFELHARESGATYGTVGRIRQGVLDDTPGSGSGGYLLRLGGGSTALPMMADVYSYPTSMSGDDRQVDMAVAVQVTARNCGREVAARVLEFRDPGPLHTRDLLLPVPPCDAGDEYLVLNEVLEDLRIAAR